VEATRTDAWVERFNERNGRAPTALHIGNIANAAYLNARMLNEAGIDCDVLCYSYYHIMGCPEWESAVFDADGINPERPLWSRIGPRGFQRPRWFAQGSLATCVDYLIARRTGAGRVDELWRQLEREQEGPDRKEEYPASLGNSNCLSAEVASRIDDLVAAFRIDFPLRPDRITFAELQDSLPFSPQYFALLRQLCSLYDVVIGYSTDGLLPLAVGKRPYLAYEHGTIRALPFEDSTHGRLCALSYSRADLSFITNCDTVIAAEKLRLNDYRFVPHPINEHVVAAPEPGALRQQLCRELEADFLIFHPARQHWEPQRNPSWEKGNDIFLKGFARFVKTAHPRAAAILVDWGKTVSQSRALIDELGIAGRIAWIPPRNAASMAAYIRASDVLADQFFLGAWGSTMPRALYLGTPAMIYVNESIHRWCFPKMPPVVNTKDSDAVHAGLCQLLDENYRRKLSAAGRAWYDKYHSNKVITASFSQAIRDVLMRTEARRLQDAARELRDVRAICDNLREVQQTLTGELRQVREELRELTRQVRVAAATLDPIVPSMLRAQRMVQLLWRPSYRAARFLYRVLQRGSQPAP
jgi:glycosyltransferase involved in cell wall biosynthesis